MPTFPVDGEFGLIYVTVPESHELEDIDREYERIARERQSDADRQQEIEDSQTAFSSYIAGPVQSLGAGFQSGGTWMYSNIGDALRTVGATGWAKGAHELAVAGELKANVWRKKSEEGGTPWLLRAGPELIAQATPYGLAAPLAGWAALGGVAGLATQQSYGTKSHEYKQLALQELRRNNPNASEEDLLWEAQWQAMPVAAGQGLKTGLITLAGGKGGQMLASRWGVGFTSAETVLAGELAGAKAGQTWGEVAKTVATSGLVEGLEEALDTAVEGTIDSITWRPDLTGEEIISRTAASAILGGIFGSGMGAAFNWEAGRIEKKDLKKLRVEMKEDAALLKPYVDAVYSKIMTEKIADMAESESLTEIPKGWRERAKEVGVKGTGRGRKKPQVWKETIAAEGKKVEDEASTLELQLTKEFQGKIKELRDVPEDVEMEDVSAYKEVMESRGVPTRTGALPMADAPFVSRGTTPTFDVEAELEAEVPTKPKRKLSKAAQELVDERALRRAQEKGDRESIMESVAEGRTQRPMPGEPVSVFEDAPRRTGEERPMPSDHLIDKGIKGLENLQRKVRQKQKRKTLKGSRRAKGKRSHGSYIRGVGYTSEGGFALPIDQLALGAADAALTAAIKAVKKGKSVAHAIDTAYVRLSKDTKSAFTKAEFEKWIMPKMYSALLDIQSNPAKTPKAAAKDAMTVLPETEADIAVKNMELQADIDAVTIKGTGEGARNWLHLIQRLYHGNARVLLDSEQEAVKVLGKAMQNSVDMTDIYYGRLAKKLMPKVKIGKIADFLSKGKQTKAFSQFEQFSYAQEQAAKDGKTAPRLNRFKDSDGDEMTPLAKEMVENWMDVAEDTGDHMEAFRDGEGRALIVEDPGAKGDPDKGIPKGWRLFKKMGRSFIPRKLKDEFQYVIDNPKKKTEDHIAFAEILREEGIIDRSTSDADLLKELRKVLTKEDGRFSAYRQDTKDGKVVDDSPSRFLAMMEKGRRAKNLPLKLMDFSFEGRVKYMSKWAERMAQIEAYGQAAGGRKDAWDVVIEAMKHEDAQSKEYLRASKRLAYNPQLALGPASKIATGLSKAATPMMLASGMSAIRNLTGMGVTTAMAPLQSTKAFVRLSAVRFLGKYAPSMKGWLTGSDFLSLKHYADLSAETEAMGVLKANMANLLGGHDYSMEGGKATRWTEKQLNAAAEAGLQLTGFTPVERFVRIHAAMTFDMFRVEALKARKEKGEKAAIYKEFKAFVERQGSLDIDSIVSEYEATLEASNPAHGPETQKYIVRAVKVVQGGYKMDQLPQYMSTPIGKFMGKFYPYGMQVATTMDVNVFRPLKETALAATRGDATLEEVGRATVPLIIAMASAAGSGELMFELRAWLFGKERPHATLGEISMQLESGSADAAVSAAKDRIFGDLFYAGTLGTVVDMVGGARSFIEKQQRLKDPLDPAPFNIINQIWGFGLRWAQEGEITPQNTNILLKRTFATYNYGQGLVLEGATKVGADWEEARLYQAKQDEYVLRRAMDRFADDVGLDLRKPLVAPEFLPGEYTQYYTAINEKLLTGNVQGAFDAAVKLAEAVDPKHRDGIAGRISQSIMAQQPMKVGKFTRIEVQREFYEWALKNLTHDQMSQMFRAQARYVNTAVNAGLVSDSPDALKKEIRRVLNGVPDKARIRKGRPISAPAYRERGSKIEFRDVSAEMMDVLSGKGGPSVPKGY